MDYTVHGVAKSWTRLNNFHFIHLKLTQHCESTILQYKTIMLPLKINYKKKKKKVMKEPEGG